MYSRNSHAPTGTMKNGARDPMSAALATLLCVAPGEEHRQVEAEEDAGDDACRTSAQRDPPARAPQQTFQMTLTVTSRQNATSTPGDSARLTAWS